MCRKCNFLEQCWPFGEVVLRLRLVADVFSKIVLQNRVNFTILISNYKKTAGVNRGNFSDLNSAYFNL